MPLEDAYGHLLHLSAVGDVADLGLAADLCRERLQPLLSPREQDAVPAAPCELAGVSEEERMRIRGFAPTSVYEVEVGWYVASKPGP